MDPSHPNWNYRQHVSNMAVLPSTTGHDPLIDELIEDVYTEDEALDSESPEKSSPGRILDGLRSSDETSPNYKSQRKAHDAKRDTTFVKRDRKIKRRRTKGLSSDEKKKQKQLDVVKPPSVWNVYCAIVTFWCPDFVLNCFGFRSKAQRRAWREKMGLISIILVLMGIVGFITFGFTAVVCGTPPMRLRVNEVGDGYMIFHGDAYDLTRSAHPAALGMPKNTNILYAPLNDEGKDGSFLFQNVNGKCKNQIVLANGSDVPTNAEGDLAWYFPCNVFNQDGTSAPNLTNNYYLGYGCHTTSAARKAFYSLKPTGNVYFTWEDLRNQSRNLIVYSGNVLDLNLLNWFNATQVRVPSQWAEYVNTTSAANIAMRGRDVTHSWQTRELKATAECFAEIIKVGSIDTETVGCIASKVLLYSALAFIIALVVTKFILAVLFQWGFSRKYGAVRTSQSSIPRKRNRHIEEWTDDIYRAPPRLAGEPGSTDHGSERMSHVASSYEPGMNRLTIPYEPAYAPRAHRALTGSFASQGSTTHLIPQVPIHRTLARQSTNGSGDFSSSTDFEGPAGFIHENAVMQPPADYQPFGFPLVHSMCLVTAYSEGEAALRTTLDSVAMTDYPNSHKTIFIVCDGLIKGHGESVSTPDIALGMMKEFTIPPVQVPAFSYVAVASGSKRHNMAKVYAGFYEYGPNSAIPAEKQQRVPVLCVVKCGTPDEAKKAKPGNRGKRDSQIILMSFLQKVMFDDRMTELEFELFNSLWKITGIPPDYYETVLMVDADTKVFPDSLTHMISAMVKDPEVMGLCGETKIANKSATMTTRIQVFEYFISHHLSKSFESMFGGVTCLPGCFCMYRIKAPKGGENWWVPILVYPDVVNGYAENVVDTLHTKNLLLLGEDRFLSTLMLRTFPKRKQIFVPQAVCKTTVPDTFGVLLSQRRRWINSTVHNLMELVLVRDLCGTFCFSMQFVVAVDLIGTLVLPAAIAFTFYVVIISIVKSPVQVIPLVLLAFILGLPAVLIVVTAHRPIYIYWMFLYLLSLPVWNFILPVYAFWKFDDFSWGDTRKTAEEKTKKVRKAGIEYEGEFDSSKITMKRWVEFERERRSRLGSMGWGGGGGGRVDYKGYNDQRASVYHEYDD